MKIATVVILYNPDGGLSERILSYTTGFSRVFIIDNSEINETSVSLLQSILNDPRFLYLHDGQNKGIALRLNQAAAMALSEGFTWLLTMDQDSFFDNQTIQAYRRCLEDLDISSIAMCGCQYEKKGNSTDNCRWSAAPFLITSGSWLNLALFNNIGSFDEALFIDGVDHEYCLRARKMNYMIIQYNHIFLNHQLGTINWGRSLLTLKKTQRMLHSPIRLYYAFRNFLYMRSNYKDIFPEYFQLMRKDLLTRIKNHLLYAEGKIKLLQLLVQALHDYKKNKMGKYNH